jgi:Homeodomain
VSPSPLQQLRSRRATAATAAAAPAPRLSKEDFHSRLPPGVAYWKTFRKTRLGRDQRDTLERVYAQTRFPSDAIIASMYDLVRLQRDDVISWFKEKRTADAIAAEEARGGRSRAPRGPRSESASASQRGARQQEAPRQHAGEEEGEEHTLRASLVRAEAPRARRTYSRPAADSPWPRSRPDAADWQPRGRTRDGEPSRRRDDRR